MYIFKSKYLDEFEHSESFLQEYIIKNWKSIFPNFKFIQKEFPLYDNTDENKLKYRIDILALNMNTNRFVIIELKKTRQVKYAIPQAIEYYNYFKDNFWSLVNELKINYPRLIPKDLKLENAHIIIFAKSFSESTINNSQYNVLEPILCTYRLYKDIDNELILTYETNLKGELNFLKTDVENNKPKIAPPKKEKPITIDKENQKHIITFEYFDINLRPPKDIKKYKAIFRANSMSHIVYFLEENNYTKPLPRLEHGETYFEDDYKFAIYRNSKNSFYLYLSKADYANIL